MAKGPIVTDAVEAIIAAVYQKYPKWKAPAVRNEVSYILRKDNPKLPSGWPSLSTVQKVLATVRRKAKELPENPQEKPWSMATLDRYPIPPEALPAVLKVWKFRIDNNGSLTVREAKWAARLYAIVKVRLEEVEESRKRGLTINPDKMTNEEALKEWASIGLFAHPDKITQEVIDAFEKALYSYSHRYALMELMYEIIEKPFDSGNPDRLLMGLPPVWGNFRNVEFFFIHLSEQGEVKEQRLRDEINRIREERKRFQEPSGAS